jgi:glycosyltransferase involved in cell wall biosynthesis
LVYRRSYDPDAVLTVVGRSAVAQYADALYAYAAELGLRESVRFRSRVSDEALSDLYEDSDVLVVASEHEGFCVPVVEAMAHDLPVVAFREGALPEVLGDAGVLVETKDPVSLAQAVRSVVGESPHRQALVEAGRRRLVALELDRAAERLAEVLEAHAQGRPLPEGSRAATHRGAPR